MTVKTTNYSIPKKIHYCWLSNERMSKEVIKCMDSWKRIMPEYELVLWDQNKFDITSVPFVEEACRVKKWAFASDYIRMYAIYQEGGIYMDTDMFALKKFDCFLHHNFFSAIEFIPSNVPKVKGKINQKINEDVTQKSSQYRIFYEGIALWGGLFGGVKGHPFAKSCMDWYSDKHYIFQDGKFLYEKYPNTKVAQIYANQAREYGFRYQDELQKLKDNMVIYPSYIFAVGTKTMDHRSYAVHMDQGYWYYNRGWKGVMERVYKKLQNNHFLRKMLGYEPIITVEILAKSQFSSKKPVFSLLHKFFHIIESFFGYKKLRKQTNKVVHSKKALVIKVSNSHFYTRHFYTLVKYFSIEGFNIYFPKFNYNFFRKSCNCTYFNFIYKENLLVFGQSPTGCETVVELNDNNLSPDYFHAPFMQNAGKNTYHIPMTMHPDFYHKKIWNKLVKPVKKRKKSIFMAGCFDRTIYSEIKNTPFKVESRTEVYDYLKENKLLTKVNSFEDLQILLKSNSDNLCVITNVDSFRIALNELRETISHFYYFLALPGVVMPHAQNLIEALSVGSIPIIHEEYARLMIPNLKHMNNAIVYNDLEDLHDKIKLAYNLDDKVLSKMKNNASKYYQENLSVSAVVNKITSKEYDLMYLQAEFWSVDILKNALSKN